MATRSAFCIWMLVVLGIFSAQNSFANNLSIANVRLADRDPSSKKVTVVFDASWENSWRNKINHDAVWLTFRLHNPGASPVHKKLCQVSASGINPEGSSSGSDTGLEVYVPQDKAGAFLRRSSNALIGDVSSQEVEIPINYESCGFSDTDEVYASVFALEMVLIPKGAFHAGDRAVSTASLKQGSADADPWYVTSESAIAVSATNADGYYYVSANNAGEDASGASFSIPAEFPKGYQAFYAMKYEINEAQWVEFVNSLPSQAARANRDLTDNNHKGTDSVISRNSISCSGSPLSCATSKPARPVSFMTWMDLAAFLDWAALRPMSELEYEKMARGPVLPIKGEFAWGSTTIVAAETISGSDEDGTETVTTNQANSNFDNTLLSGGDSAQGPEHQSGALRNGIFASDSSERETAGASYYGVMELSGNLAERVVTIGNATGRSFTGSNGNGSLTTASGSEGNADASWPGLDLNNSSNGVNSAVGTGFKGGSWQDTYERLRISDRFGAALEAAQSSGTFGGRGVRTYDGE